MRPRHPKDKLIFHHIFRVKNNDIDALSHVNNIVYLKWVQEISGMHWFSVAPKEIKNASIWVALRHEIDYLHQAFENDLIESYTWIEKNEGVKSIRIVHFFCRDKLLAKAKTTWCLLDAKTRRPKRLSKEIMDLFLK